MFPIITLTLREDSMEIKMCANGDSRVYNFPDVP